MLYIFAPTSVEGGEDKTRLVFLYERKEQVYENLRDLSFEHKAGKLSDGDYTGLRDAMELDAAAILAEIDRLERAGVQPPPEGGRS